MQTLRTVIAIQLAIVVTGLAVDASASEPRATKAIGGVAIGASSVDVKKALGEPADVRHTWDALDSEWHYGEQLTVFFWDRDQQVAEIRSESPKACTDTGVCPGTTISAVQSTLGAPVGNGPVSEGSNQYRSVEETCWLDVVVHKGRVSSIALRCQP
jgi:hypothetical protein